MEYIYFYVSIDWNELNLKCDFNSVFYETSDNSQREMQADSMWA